jgi:hypothetical protein
MENKMFKIFKKIKSYLVNEPVLVGYGITVPGAKNIVLKNEPNYYDVDGINFFTVNPTAGVFELTKIITDSKGVKKYEITSLADNYKFIVGHRVFERLFDKLETRSFSTIKDK